MINWFVLLTPFLLFPILLLFVFTGCSMEGTITGASSRVIFLLRYSLLTPTPNVTKVYFQWTIESNGDVFGPFSSYVEDFEVKTGDSGEQFHDFRHQIENPMPGQWTITCSPFSGTIILGEAICGPFELTLSTTTVQFEVAPDPVNGGKAQVSPGGCPS